VSSLPNSPHLLEGGIVLLDPGSSSAPASVRAAIQSQHAQPHLAGAGNGAERGHRSEPVRLKAPPVGERLLSVKANWKRCLYPQFLEQRQ
jgi:hypothetical protein